MLYRKICMLTAVLFISLFSSFTASAKSSADVVRIEGSDRYKTAVAVSREGWKVSSEYVVLATGENFPDALSAAPLARKYNAPVLLSSKDELDTDTIEEIKRLKSSKAFIIGGTGVISQSVENRLKSIGVVPVRIAGLDRYETSIRVAEKVGFGNGAFVVTGLDFSDAVSAAPIASKKSMPIILVPGGNLPRSVKGYLAGKVKSTIYIVGSDTVSEDESRLLPNAEIITGYNSYQRNINILKKFSDQLDFNTLYISTGRDYPDALAASVLAANTSSAVVLTDYTIPQDAEDFVRTRLVSRLCILGGTGAVGPDIESQLKYLPAEIVSAEDITASVAEKGKYDFPKTVSAKLSSGGVQEVPVTWNLSSVDTSKSGVYTYKGTLKGYDDEVTLSLEVLPVISSFETTTCEVVQSETFEFPETVLAKMSNNSMVEVPVTWSSSFVNLNKTGTYSFQGTADGYNKKVTLSLKVVEDSVVEITDRRLRHLIKDELDIDSSYIYKSDALKVKSLKFEDENIEDLTGLENFANLETLDLGDNDIENIESLGNLANLRSLWLNNNIITDIAPLQKLTRLKYLNLKGNEIENIAPLSNLIYLKTLYLDGNDIDNFAPVKPYYKNLLHSDFDPYED